MADVVVLKERVEIDPDKPLPEYDLPNAKAFSAVARKEGGVAMVAYVCDPDTPLRFEAIEPMRSYAGPGLIRFVEWGVIYWAPQRRRLTVIVYELPVGGRLLRGNEATVEPFSEDRLIKNFLTPVIALMRDMSARGVTHRAIRVNNLFYSDKARKNVVLGDCLTAPPGLHNDPLFEPLEQGMADPSGRGSGGVGDDVYALGVIVIFLTLGKLPRQAMDPTEAINRKIAQGSYGILTAGARIPASVVELLRGMLSDDPRERWSLREIELWLGGRRLTPKQPKLPNKAARPMIVGGTEGDNPRTVAEALARNWLIAPDIVRGQDFDNWVRRSLGDDRVLENVNKVLGSAAVIEAVPEADNQKLVTRACMALDPPAPLRHKGFSAFMDGVGNALAIGFERDDVRQKVAEFINARLIGQWMTLQARNRSELNELYSTFDKLPALINQGGPGFGIERVLYELNPNLHCRSPQIETFYITRIEELVPALERAAQRQDRGTQPIDRHIAAFTAARTSEIDDRYLRPLAAQEHVGTERTLAMLKLLVRVQAVSKNGPCPNLCGWFAELMTPAINSFHNLKIRKAVEVSVARAVEAGLLIELLNIFGDAKAAQRDSQGYQRAQQEHTQCNAQMQQLSIEIENKEHLATELGEQVAAVCAGVLGSIGSTAVIVMYML